MWLARGKVDRRKLDAMTGRGLDVCFGEVCIKAFCKGHLGDIAFAVFWF